MLKALSEMISKFKKSITIIEITVFILSKNNLECIFLAKH